MIRELLNWISEKHETQKYQNGNMPADIVALLNEPID